MAESTRRTNTTRLIIFLLVALIHGALILFLVIRVEAVNMAAEPPVMVMKLTDIAEDTPPPPPPPPPKVPPPEQPPNAVESIAETMLETEEVPEEQVVVDPGTLVVSEAPVQTIRVVPAEPERETEEYLPMHKISVPPKFDERDILRALVYPPIARRAGIEGVVYLELFVDRHGVVQQVTILKENPPDRGFGEAAAAAFRGRRGTPAEANDHPVAVRYRYPVRFALKG